MIRRSTDVKISTTQPLHGYLICVSFPFPFFETAEMVSPPVLMAEFLSKDLPLSFHPPDPPLSSKDTRRSMDEELNGASDTCPQLQRSLPVGTICPCKAPHS